jgi:hypothetical protein
MFDSISCEGYEILLDSEQLQMRIINTSNGDIMHLSIEEAIDLLKLMYGYRNELSMLRTGE